LRRSLGAARRHIAAQFRVESTTLGLLGGIVGAALEPVDALRSTM
jgi:putative ABC transport system permease protein